MYVVPFDSFYMVRGDGSTYAGGYEERTHEECEADIRLVVAGGEKEIPGLALVVDGEMVCCCSLSRTDAELLKEQLRKVHAGDRDPGKPGGDITDWGKIVPKRKKGK